MAPSTEFDVVISGGGANGCAAALALAKATDLRIAIVEAHPQNATTLSPGFDSRVVALAKQSQLFLDDVGVWAQMAAVAEPIHQILVSDQGHWGKARIGREQQGVDALGYVIALDTMGQHLTEALAMNNQVTWFRPDSIAGVDKQSGALTLTLSSGASLNTGLLINAEGANSPSRERCGIEAVTTAYEQVALIANVEVALDHGNRAFERFTPNGPLALLPMSGKHMSLVWTLPPQQQDWALEASDEDFLAALQSAFGQRLGRFTAVSQRYCYPLALKQSESIVGHRTALVGNAAQSLHPIAGQGLNLGLRDVATLVETIVAAVNAGRDVGEYQVLRKYQRSRQQDRQRTVAITHSLVHVFSNTHWPLAIGRNLGLVTLDRLGWLKGRFADITMGRG